MRVPKPDVAEAWRESPREPHDDPSVEVSISPARSAIARPRWTPLLRYVVAVVATVGAFLARMWLSRYLGPPYILFYPTVMVIAVLAGFGPGLVATGLSALFSALVVLPAERQASAITTRDVVGLVLFTSAGLFMSVVARLYRQARQRLVEYERARVLKASDERVRASEQRLRAIMETVPDPVFLKDRDSRLVLANPATLRAIGKPEDEVLGRCDRELYDDPEVGEAILSTDRRIMGSGVPEVVEERIQTPSGYRVFLSTKAPYRDAQGRVVGLIGIARDITDRKGAEDALRRSEATLAQAGEMAHLGAWWIEISDPGDLNANPLRWSDEVYRIFGFAPGSVEVTSELFFNAVHPDDRPRIADAVAKALAAKRPYEVEHRIIRPDGAERFVLEHAEFAFDDTGRPLRLIGAVQDTTERKKAEEALSVLTRLYAVLSRVNEAIVRTHSEQSLYQGVCRIVADDGGFPLVWIGLVKQREIVPAAWSGPEADYLRHIKVEVEGELGRGPTGTCVREDRAVTNYDFASNPSAAPWRKTALDYGLRASVAFPLHRQGRIIGALTLYARDPGAFSPEQIKLLEALSADISYALDAMEQERLRAQAEQALRESERNLRDVDRRKNEFLGVLSHELRNPLAPIRNALYILDEAAPGGEQAIRAKAVVSRQVDHLTRLVDDLLDVTRISRGRDHAPAQPIRLEPARAANRRGLQARPRGTRDRARRKRRPWAGGRGRGCDAHLPGGRQSPAEQREVHGCGRAGHRHRRTRRR